MIKKPHPPSQKEKCFSLGTFGTHTASFKCFYQTYQGLEQRFSKPKLNDSWKGETLNNRWVIKL